VWPANATIPASFRWTPKGHEHPEEGDVRDFCRECPQLGVDAAKIDDWWVSQEFRGPTWDLLAECRVGGAAGLILVEAKAHESELGRAGKKAPDPFDARSMSNHATIERCMADAEGWYRRALSPDSRLSTSTHYQLASRLAAAAMLASCGVHVVLLYLGFTGDTYFEDHLTNDAHWQQTMRAYLKGVVPSWPGQVTPHESGGSVRLLIRSLPVIDVSRPRRAEGPSVEARPA
jgi:hypothetical protein